MLYLTKKKNLINNKKDFSHLYFSFSQIINPLYKTILNLKFIQDLQHNYSFHIKNFKQNYVKVYLRTQLQLPTFFYLFLWKFYKKFVLLTICDHPFQVIFLNYLYQIDYQFKRLYANMIIYYIVIGRYFLQLL